MADEEKSGQESQSLKHSLALHWIHWAILGMSLVLTLLAWRYSDQQSEAKLAAEFERESERVIELIRERMNKYEDALWAGVALHSVKENQISYHDWKTYTDHIRLEVKYPGINGIGVIKKVPRENLQSHLQEEQKFVPHYKVYPEHDLNTLYPIVYIEPIRDNAKALGLDMAHESNRLTAVRKSRDSGTAQITGPITLVQDKTKTAGFLFFAPIYGPVVPKTIGGRQRTFYGVVYAPFIVKKLMEGTLRAETRHVTLTISDAGTTSDNVIFDEHNDAVDQFDPNPLYRRTVEIPLYGRVWRFEIWSSLVFRKVASNNQSIFILIGGILIDTLLLFLFISMTRSNQRAIEYANQMTADLQQSNLELNKARQQADEASEAKSTFLANVSHELRTPMNSILGFCRRLLKPEGMNNKERAIDALQTVERNASHLLQLINQILDVSKIEAGEMRAYHDDFDAAELIRDTIDVFTPLAEDKGIELDLRMSANAIRVRADKTKLRQILSNLLSNAVKFTDNGLVSMAVEQGESRQDLRISVEDTGTGIKDEDQRKLFARFSELSSTRTCVDAGTGLGLHLTQELVHLHKGRIEVESIFGKGTKFTVTLPVLIDEQDSPNTTTQDSETSPTLYV